MTWTPTKADLPIELNFLPNLDLFKEALPRGRPLMIVRLGQREMTLTELAGESVPGTVLLPGDRMLPPPAVPPYIPWGCFPMIDPLAGPKENVLLGHLVPVGTGFRPGQPA